MKDKGHSSAFLSALQQREQAVMDYLLGGDSASWFQNTDLREGVYAYLQRPAKRLRPAVLLLACGAVGGDEAVALPAAAGVELFHTWTLVHDDVIDNDEFRRGGPTIHRLFSDRLPRSTDEESAWADEYGRDLAILVGDSQHAWSVWLFLETAVRTPDLSPVVIKLAQHIEAVTINQLIEGEILDVQFTRQAIPELSREAITKMLYLKTGTLYEYAAMAGAAIGLREVNWEHPWIAALGKFARLCGTAFQLQDDILGIVGDQERLGKPVGSDICEGKRTTVTYYAFRNATDAQRHRLDAILGRRDAPDDDVQEARKLLVDLGGVRRTQDLAREMTEEALPALSALPDSPSKSLMLDWARFLIERKF